MMRRNIVFWLTVLCLSLAVSAAAAAGWPECQKVEMSNTDVTQDNKSVIRTWQVETYQDSVSATINNMVAEFEMNMSQDLPEAKNNTSKNSRLDVDVRYSRTGEKWLSFLVTGRTTYHRAFTSTQLASRTYNMETAEQIHMSDLFDEDSPAWALLSQQVREQVTAYYPSETPRAELLDFFTKTEQLRAADFTLHGVSIVLHYPAEVFYPDHHHLIEVTIMYPQLEGMFSELGAQITDNSMYKMVALTFDDGPSRTPTTRLLNQLKENGVRATFFVLGNRIAENEDLIQREHDEGHAIGAHNFTHADARKVSATTLRSYVGKFDAALEAAIGLHSRYDRVPYGLYVQMVEAKVGWPLIQWSVDTYDWRGLAPAKVLSAVKNEAEDGDIILCHDIKDKSAQSADLVTTYLAENGYLLVTIDELFAREGVTLEPNIVYYHCIDGEYSRKKAS